jgi:hypothetical protein
MGQDRGSKHHVLTTPSIFVRENKTIMSPCYPRTTSFAVIQPRIQKPFWHRKPLVIGFIKNRFGIENRWLSVSSKTVKPEKPNGFRFKTQISNFMDKYRLADRFLIQNSNTKNL